MSRRGGIYAPAAQHALELPKELLIVRASRALLLESFAAELGRYTDTGYDAGTEQRNATIRDLHP